MNKWHPSTSQMCHAIRVDFPTACIFASIVSCISVALTKPSLFCPASFRSTFLLLSIYFSHHCHMNLVSIYLSFNLPGHMTVTLLMKFIL